MANSEESLKVEPLTADETKKVRIMLENWDRSLWLGRWIFKLVLWITGTIALVAQFKNNIIALFKG